VTLGLLRPGSVFIIVWLCSGVERRASAISDIRALELDMKGLNPEFTLDAIVTTLHILAAVVLLCQQPLHICKFLLQNCLILKNIETRQNIWMILYGRPATPTVAIAPTE